MNENIRHWTYLSLLISFIIILFFTIISFNYTINPKEAPSYLFFFVKYHSFFMFFIAIFGVIFGSLTQIITSKKIEYSKKQMNNLKNHFKNYLTKDEKKIIDYLIKNKGISTQYELTKLFNNKLKTSRLLIDMKEKKIITKEKIGKINKVFLDKDLLDIFEK